MKKGSILFLEIVTSLIGIAVLALITVFTINVANDEGGLFLPVLIIMYVTAMPFFFALFQTLKLLSYIDKNSAFSDLSIRALKKIKYCAFIVSALYTAGMPFLVSVADKDDAPGAVGFGVVFIFASITIATVAAILQKLVQSGLDMKSENDLTV